jgi:hypothetical protein
MMPYVQGMRVMEHDHDRVRGRCKSVLIEVSVDSSLHTKFWCNPEHHVKHDQGSRAWEDQARTSKDETFKLPA